MNNTENQPKEKAGLFSQEDADAEWERISREFNRLSFLLPTDFGGIYPKGKPADAVRDAKRHAERRAERKRNKK